VNSGNRKGLTTIIVILSLLALVALVAGCSNPARLDGVVGKPAVDLSRPTITWSF
jgi:hypothetical protein